MLFLLGYLFSLILSFQVPEKKKKKGQICQIQASCEPAKGNNDFVYNFEEDHVDGFEDGGGVEKGDGVEDGVEEGARVEDGVEGW